MKQIVILSGKGGTGKTLLTASLGTVLNSTVFADCDVEAPNLSYLLKTDIYKTLDFESGNTTVRETDECNGCKKCLQVCRFDALKYLPDKNRVMVLPYFCSGCEYCSFICPRDAIYLIKTKPAKIFLSKTNENDFVFAKITPGERASGKIVSIIRKYSEELALNNNKKYILIDGAPGLGCPVIAAVSNVDVALLVAEPSLSGIADLTRLVTMLKHFNFKKYIVINKFDMNIELTTQIENYGKENKIDVIEKIPYNSEIPKYLNHGKNYFIESDNMEIKNKILNIKNYLV